MKKAKKITVMYFAMIVSLLMQIISPTYAIYVPEEETQFVISLDSNNEDLDLSDIVINVYTATLAYVEEESGYYEYEETLSFSVSPNSSGKAVFSRPSECFSLTVQTGFFASRLWGIRTHQILLP